MKIHKQLKIEAACSKDKDRKSILEPYLDRSGDGDKLISTNGHIIAVVPVECDDSDTTGYVPLACLKDARKLGYVGLNGTATVGGISYPRESGEQFPNWKVVIPDNSGVKVVRLCLDSEYLRDLAAAMGTNGVALEIPVGNYADGSSRLGIGNCVIDPIVVRPATARGLNPAEPDAMGVIMPMRIAQPTTDQ